MEIYNEALILILLTFIQAHAKKEETVPCQPDWYFFDGKCYKLGRDETGLLKLSWEGAAAKCTEYGGHLATIHSKTFQKFFLATFLSDTKAPIWIGLYRRDIKHSFEWHDGSPVAYTNWGKYEPHKYYLVEDEDCVQMRYGGENMIGKWYNSKCNYNNAFVCQMEQDKKLSSMDLRFCPDSLGGGRRFRDSCFNLVNLKKNWIDAEEYCVQHYNGHLATIPDIPTRILLNSLLDEKYNDDFWVGLHIEKLKSRQNVLRWTSGRYLDFGLGGTFWKDYSLKCFESVPGFTGLCVALSSEKKPWKFSTCNQLKPFFCEHSLNESSSSLNGKKVSDINCPIASGNIDDWVDFGGDQCYSLSKKPADSWEEANFECMQSGGFLASIHSQEELDDLKQFFSYYEPTVHIGLFRIQHGVNRFRWADGSEVDFEAWDDGEPHDTNWRDECVQMKTSSMKWSTVGCIMDVKYSICSIKKKAHVLKEEESIHLTYSDAEAKTVPCLPDWIYVDEKCYKVAKDEEGLLELSWEDAAKKCVEYGGHLATISNWDFKDDYKTNFLHDIKKNTWIGLHRLDGNLSFTWHDGSPFSYTNWDKKKSTPQISGQQKDCVEAIYTSSIYGDVTMNNVNCDDKKPFVCQMKEDLILSSPDVRYCPEALGGGRRFRDSCLHFVNEEKNWGDAEEHCVEHYKGHLVTISDEIMRNFFNYILGWKSRNEYWVGIHLQNGLLQKWSSGRYVDLEVRGIVWRDWIKTYNNSIYDFSDFCVMLNERGYWGVSNCMAYKYFICQVTLPKSSPSINLLQVPSPTCPDNFDEWFDIGGDKCYYISGYASSSWYDANHECMKRGSYLTSIHSQEELDTLTQLLSYSGEETFIGLFRSLNANQFLWVDGTKVDFEAWEMGEPNNRSDECVLLNGGTSKWIDIPCSIYQKYICSVQKVSPVVNQEI